MQVGNYHNAISNAVIKKSRTSKLVLPTIFYNMAMIMALIK